MSSLPCARAYQLNGDELYDQWCDDEVPGDKTHHEHHNEV